MVWLGYISGPVSALVRGTNRSADEQIKPVNCDRVRGCTRTCVLACVHVSGCTCTCALGCVHVNGFMCGYTQCQQFVCCVICLHVLLFFSCMWRRVESSETPIHPPPKHLLAVLAALTSFAPNQCTLLSYVSIACGKTNLTPHDIRHCRRPHVEHFDF